MFGEMAFEQKKSKNLICYFKIIQAYSILSLAGNMVFIYKKILINYIHGVIILLDKLEMKLKILLKI